MALLHLNLKGEYFDEIAAGNKPKEYRLYTDYWKKRLINKEYDGILIKKGYPKKDDKSRIIFREWRGYEIEKITHPHFDNKPVKVFGIRVN